MPDKTNKSRFQIPDDGFKIIKKTPDKSKIPPQRGDNAK